MTTGTRLRRSTDDHKVVHKLQNLARATPNRKPGHMSVDTPTTSQFGRHVCTMSNDRPIFTRILDGAEPRENLAVADIGTTRSPASLGMQLAAVCCQVTSLRVPCGPPFQSGFDDLRLRRRPLPATMGDPCTVDDVDTLSFSSRPCFKHCANSDRWTCEMAPKMCRMRSA